MRAVRVAPQLFIAVTLVVFFGGVAESRSNICDESIVVESLKGPVTLEQATQIISKQTGCDFDLEAELKAIDVRGSYENVTISIFFRRTLKDVNHSITYDNNSNLISVKPYGIVDRNMVVKGMDDLYHAHDLERIFSDEMILLREQQEKNGNFLTEKSSAREPLTGILLSDIAMTSERQNKALLALEENPDAREPLSGEYYSEIKRIQDKQNSYLQDIKGSDLDVEPLTGISYNKINSIQEAQELAAKENNLNYYKIEEVHKEQ